MKPAQNNVLLELHVPDFGKVKEYYGKLGFKVIWEREPEGFKGYLILKMRGNILCFWAETSRFTDSLILKDSLKIQKGLG